VASVPDPYSHLAYRERSAFCSVLSATTAVPYPDIIILISRFVTPYRFFQFNPTLT